MKIKLVSISLLLHFVYCAELPRIQYKNSKNGRFNMTLEVIEPGITTDSFSKGSSQISTRAVLRKGLIESDLFKSIVNFNGDLQLRVLNNEKEEVQEFNGFNAKHKLSLTFILLKDKKEIFSNTYSADETATTIEKFSGIQRVGYATIKATARCLEQFLEEISKQKL
ncbi:hypothetical protein ND860_00840 [Leptospira levettii]|uniref:hypothetical protein n=1 Tax=Leptospira levettii TaxID=2023178 RepID=UPI0010829909|nr:hypothetical protein [Leptospira levettii]MCW7495052.1 hypothetical protein [Leptospira levettii]TGM27458.1 hypothetical protein EHQ71_15645 [Leptospira levettii]TGM83954.1 hypothetical protein EHR00_13010 [Leptospira levettii]